MCRYAMLLMPLFRLEFCTCRTCNKEPTSCVYWGYITFRLFKQNIISKARPIKGTWQWGGFSGVFAEIPHRSLTLPSSRSAFGFEFAEIFVIEKRLPDSASRRVGDSPTRQVGESLTLRLGESGSRRLTDSPSRGVGFWMFKRKTGRVGESATPRLG